MTLFGLIVQKQLFKGVVFVFRFCYYHPIKWLLTILAPLAQWTEQRSSKALMWVRFLQGAQMQFLISIFNKIPVLILLLLSTVAVLFGDYMGKYWSTNPKPIFFVLALLGYLLTGFFYVPILLREGLVVSALLWVLLDTLGFIFIGLVLFHEQLNLLQIIGIILGIISLIVLSVGK